MPDTPTSREDARTHDPTRAAAVSHHVDEDLCVSRFHFQACSTPAFKATSDALSTFMRAMKSMRMPSRRSSVLRWP